VAFHLPEQEICGSLLSLSALMFKCLKYQIRRCEGSRQCKLPFPPGMRRDRKRKWCIDVEKKKEPAGKPESEILIGLRTMPHCGPSFNFFFHSSNHIELPFLTIAMGTERSTCDVCVVCVRPPSRPPIRPRKLPVESY
jgi:hypothetical protein